MFEYLNANKEWIFSGVGVAIVSGLAVLIARAIRKTKPLVSIGTSERSHFSPKEKGRAIEKYMVTDIYRFNVKNNVYDLAQLQLVQSSIRNGCGFAGVHVDKEKIVFHHYGFANNCFHAIIAPGDIILDQDAGTLKAQSNEFKSISIDHNPKSLPKEFLPDKYRKIAIESLLVSMEFQFPKTYTGPMYQSKTILLAKGIGLIKSVTTYRNGQTDEFILKNHLVKEASDAWWPVHTLGNYWEYEINYSLGPNKVNIKHG